MTCPVLVIGGGLDRTTPPTHARAVADATDGAELIKALRPTLPNTDITYQYSPESFSQTELDYALETSTRKRNLFTCFPGFLIFAQHWYGLRWGFDVTTRARLVRVRPGTEVGRFTRRDGTRRRRRRS